MESGKSNSLARTTSFGPRNAGLITDLHKHRIFQLTIDAETLVRTYPPQVKNGNKKILFDLSMKAKHNGEIVVSKWSAMPDPGKFSTTKKLAIYPKSTGYIYINRTNEPVMDWYVNFADANLFFAYGGPLFAQDEFQVTEHPALASVRECLQAKKDKEVIYTPRVRDSQGKITPVLVQGVERRIDIKTDVNPKEGRPKGLYGNHFANAEPEAVKKATTLLNPPTKTNIIAMAALGYLHGTYTFGQINDMFITAYSSFLAARYESIEAFQKKGVMAPKVAIHTGYWGCGAFGGNRVVMSLIQLLAAQLAEVDEVYFYTVNDNAPLEEAIKLFAAQLPSGAGGGSNSELTVGKVLNNLVDMGFKWGTSDGN